MNKTKKEARADILSRSNAMSGRYEKGGFKLGFWYKDFEIEGPNVLMARANLADNFIAKAQFEGKDVDDPTVLKVIAQKVNSKVYWKIWRNRFIALSIIILVIVVLIIFIT